ncbi:MAG: hypothetical protein ACO1N3_00755 [Gammaproteobacteria bacterium]
MDFLVHMQPGSGFSLGALQSRLEALLKQKVDLVPGTSIHRSIREKNISEAVPL